MDQPTSIDAPPRTRPRRRLTLGLLMLLIAVVGPIIGFEARRIVNARKGRDLQPIARVPVEGLAYKLALSHDRRSLALLCFDRPLELRDSTTLERIGPATPPGRGVHAFAFAKTGDLFAHHSPGQPIRVVRGERVVPLGHPAGLGLILALSDDGRWLAAGNYGGGVGLWRLADDRLLRELKPSRTDGGLTPAFNPDGRYLAVGNRNDVTDLFDVVTGEHILSLRLTMTQEIAFSPDGKALAATYVDGTLALWSMPDGRLLRKATTRSKLYSVDWSPDGMRLVTGGLSNDITVWEASTLKVLRSFKAAPFVTSVKFGPDGRSVIYVGARHGSTSTPKSHLGIFDLPGGFYAGLEAKDADLGKK